MAIQAEVWAAADAKGANASQVATPGLLAFLDSAEFRADIANISSIANASSEEILVVLQQIVRSSHAHHNFPLLSSGLDVNLTIMMNEGYIPNYYTASVQGYLAGGSGTSGTAETQIMGFPEITNSSSLTQAWIRPSYLCVNIYNIAGGCLLFGQVSLVSRPSWIQNMTILSAVDTGLYAAGCLNASFSGGNGGGPNGGGPNGGGPGGNNTNAMGGGGMGGMAGNCSGWDGVVGTYDHFNHLILSNINYERMSLAWLLQHRLNGANFSSPSYYGQKTPMAYIEGDVAGALLIPQSVSYMQMSISGVLGTTIGAKAMTWAESQGWPLVWCQGTPMTNDSNFGGDGGPGGNNNRTGGGRGPNGGGPGNNNSTGGPGGNGGGGGGGLFNNVDTTILDLENFFLDPYTAMSTTNISISESELEASQEFFTSQWNYYGSLSSVSTNTTYWSAVWNNMLVSISPSLLLKYSDSFSCADLDNCFAVQISTGDCVCRTT